MEHTDPHLMDVVPTRARWYQRQPTSANVSPSRYRATTGRRSCLAGGGVDSARSVIATARNAETGELGPAPALGRPGPCSAGG
jgi:hypothetical protein